MFINKLTLAFASIAIFLIGCQKKDSTVPSLVKQRSWSEVLSIAEHYGFDSLSLPIERNNAYMYRTQEELEQALKDRQQSRESHREFLIFREKNADIRTIEDYENLINSLPHYKATHMKSFGGPSEYERSMAAMRKQEWHIYRDSSGVLGFVPATEDHGQYNSRERIDNKPRNQ